jgi:hypothetical protein
VSTSELGCPRQNLIIYASTDTAESRMALAQTKISGVYARTQKNIQGYAFVFRASVGPVSRAEQEFIHEWMLSQRAVTFEESEPLLEMEEDDDDEGESEQDVIAERPAPMWDDDQHEEVPPAAAEKNREVGVRQRTHSHQAIEARRRPPDPDRSRRPGRSARRDPRLGQDEHRRRDRRGAARSRPADRGARSDRRLVGPAQRLPESSSSAGRTATCR